MAVLSHDEILEAISKGDILIDPLDEDQIGPASVDLTLSDEFRYYEPLQKIVKVNEKTDYKEMTVHMKLKEGESYLLLPGHSALGITKEKITLAPHLCGMLEGRSRFARLGLFVHITAGFMQPGINNHQVLEIYNGSNHALELFPGTRICQFIFLEMKGNCKYEGRFKSNPL